MCGSTCGGALRPRGPLRVLQLSGDGRPAATCALAWARDGRTRTANGQDTRHRRHNGAESTRRAGASSGRVHVHVKSVHTVGVQ